MVPSKMAREDYAKMGKALAAWQAFRSSLAETRKETRDAGLEHDILSKASELFTFVYK